MNAHLKLTYMLIHDAEGMIACVLTHHLEPLPKHHWQVAVLVTAGYVA